MTKYQHLCDILLVCIMNIFTSWSWKLQILFIHYLKYALLTVNDQCSFQRKNSEMLIKFRPSLVSYVHSCCRKSTPYTHFYQDHNLSDFVTSVAVYV